MSALAALKRDPVARLESEIVATEKRVERFAARVAELESADEVDAVKIAATEREIEAAKSERAILTRALDGARDAQKKEAAAQKAREKEALRVRSVARVAVLQPKLTEILIQAAVVAGELVSLQNSLEGSDAMAALPALAAIAAGKIATRDTRPKVVPAEDAHGRKFDLVTDTNVREVRLDLLCPAVEIG